MNIGELALLSLLAEYARQFQEALDSAEAELSPLVEPVKARAWKPNTGFHIFPPTESTPSELWGWIEVRDTHPSLIEMQDVLNRFSTLVGHLENAEPRDRRHIEYKEKSETNGD